MAQLAVIARIPEIPAPDAVVRARRMRPRSDESDWMQAATLTAWATCLAVGIAGGVWGYPHPAPAAAAPSLPPVEALEVALTTDPLPVPDTAAAVPPAPAMLPAPPPAAPPARPTSTPSLVPVATAVAVPAAVFPVREAASAGPVPAAAGPAPSGSADNAGPGTSAVPAPEALVFGQGEGRQPAPEYPPRARREGQEGTAVIRFTVGADGRVESAEAVRPTRWPLLNESALRAVRERWRFRAGTVRRYEVSIRFELTR